MPAKAPRFLFLNQFYYPDKAATAIYLSSLAEELARRGAEVHVVCGSFSYVETEQLRSHREGVVNGVHVHRVRNTAFGRSKTLGRLVDFASYYLGATYRAFRHGPWDGIVGLTTPPYLYMIGLLCKTFRTRRAYLWSMDCYPHVQVTFGQIREGGLIHRSLRLLNRIGYPRLDAAIALDENMAGVLSDSGARRVSVIENWEHAETFAGESLPPEQVREELGVPPDTLLVSYIGNMGRGHEFETVLSAAEELQNRNAPVYFLFRGGGPNFETVQAQVEKRGLRNAAVDGYLGDRRNVVEATHASDFGLVILRDEAKGLIAPSKFYGTLASGTAVLFIGPEDAHIARLVRENSCGAEFRIGDSHALADFLEKAASDAEAVAQTGANAKELFNTRFEAHMAFDKFWALLNPGARTGETAPQTL